MRALSGNAPTPPPAAFSPAFLCAQGATGAIIKVSQPSEMIQATQERVITITGSVQAVDAAQDAITRRMAQAPPQQQIRETDYSVLKYAAQGLPPPRPATTAVTAAPPPWGYHHPPIGSEHPPLVAPPPVGSIMPYKTFVSTLPPTIPQDEAARLYGEHCRAAGEAAGAAGMLAGGGVGVMPGTAGVGLLPQPRVSGEQVTEKMNFPDRVISGIIGRGGANIRDVIQRSGAKVNVSQKNAPDRVPGERTVTITGTTEQVGRASEILAGRVREIEAEGAARQMGVAGAPPAYGVASVASYGAGRYVPPAPQPQPAVYAPPPQPYQPAPYSPTQPYSTPQPYPTAQPYAASQPAQYAPPPASTYSQYPPGYSTSPTPPGYAFGSSNPWGGSSGYSW